MSFSPIKGDAFALAGLGGFNAHGAGFLAAAQKHRWIPELVTATSGQILVVAEWLQGRDLKSFLVDKRREADPFAQLSTAWLGYPGVFRPAYTEAIKRFCTPPSPDDSLVGMVADRLLPAQSCITTRTDDFFQEIADTLNGRPAFSDEQIGVVFNTYDPSSGKGRLYGNDRARDLLPKATKLKRQKAIASAPGMEPHPEIKILPITAEAVKSALWLSLYGFEGVPNNQMDGAYFRSCIVQELYVFPRVFVVRPLAQGWVGKAPTNWFDVQDWQYEMWFSAGYKAELEGLKRINDLISQGYLEAKKFRIVDIHEIEPETPAGYFHYFVERASVFERAYRLADELFTALKSQEAPSESAKKAPERDERPRPPRGGDGRRRPSAAHGGASANRHAPP